MDTTRVKLDVLKPWIGKRVAEFIGMEDDVVVEFIFNQLEAKVIIDCLLRVGAKYEVLVLIAQRAIFPYYTFSTYFSGSRSKENANKSNRIFEW